jgi:hypothetical protein
MALERHWARWYSSARWKRIRAQQLRAEPWCAMHKLNGKEVPATVADHIERHCGDPVAFWTGRLQSLCRDCHQRHKRFYEQRGYTRDVGVDGYPLDPNHPANAPRRAFKAAQ